MSTTPKRDGIFGDRSRHEQPEDHQPSVVPRAGEDALPRLDQEDEEEFVEEPDKITS